MTGGGGLAYLCYRQSATFKVDFIAVAIVLSLTNA